MRGIGVDRQVKGRNNRTLNDAATASARSTGWSDSQGWSIKCSAYCPYLKLKSPPAWRRGQGAVRWGRMSNTALNLVSRRFNKRNRKSCATRRQWQRPTSFGSAIISANLWQGQPSSWMTTINVVAQRWMVWAWYHTRSTDVHGPTSLLLGAINPHLAIPPCTVSIALYATVVHFYECLTVKWNGYNVMRT